MKDRGHDLVPASRVAGGASVATEARRLRHEAARRYRETDLIAAAMREHIADLQRERDHLLTEIARLRDQVRRESAAWLLRGQRPQH